jgi:homopolymeric O-antigen transport system permease protein
VLELDQPPETNDRSSPLDTILRHKDLITNLTLRDFRLRYRNSALGFLWSLLNPLAMMVVLTAFYTFVFKSGVSNFPLFVLPPLLIWRFFAISTSMSLEAIAGNPSLVTKVLLPRWLLVLSGNLANLLGTSLEFLALFPLMIFLGAQLTWLVVLIPFVLLLEFLLVIGVSLILSSVNVYYRDFGQVWEIFLQAGFFLSPIFYSESVIPQAFQLVYSLNPIARLIESTRKVLYSGQLPTAFDILIVLGAGALLLFVGWFIFGRLEKKFGELV